MGVHEYRDDDDGYRDWLKKHPGGYVINIQRSHSPADAFLHDAGCSSLIAQLDRDVSLTGQYVKVCGGTLAEVQQWANGNVNGPVPPCGVCRYVGPDSTTPQVCPRCSIYVLSVSGKCPKCDED
jgi:hypothetical protein